MRRVFPVVMALASVFVGASAHGEAPRTAPAPKRPGPVAHVTRPTPAKYGQYVKRWHTPTPDKNPPVDDKWRPMLALVALNTNDRIELPALTGDGGFTASALDRAAYVLREGYSGNEHPIDPRLLDVVYKIQTHFAAQEVRVISGYRTPGGSSNHGKGRAMDVVIPGVSDEDVAKFAREIGFVGVGVYPTSGFVHVDVRDRSYFWVDASGPGWRNRERRILPDLASKSDARALARGERPPSPFVIGPDVDLALAARGPATSTPDGDDDDDTD